MIFIQERYSPFGSVVFDGVGGSGGGGTDDGDTQGPATEDQAQAESDRSIGGGFGQAGFEGDASGGGSSGRNEGTFLDDRRAVSMRDSALDTDAAITDNERDNQEIMEQNLAPPVEGPRHDKRGKVVGAVAQAVAKLALSPTIPGALGAGAGLLGDLKKAEAHANEGLTSSLTSPSDTHTVSDRTSVGVADTNTGFGFRGGDGSTNNQSGSGSIRKPSILSSDIQAPAVSIPPPDIVPEIEEEPVFLTAGLRNLGPAPGRRRTLLAG